MTVFLKPLKKEAIELPLTLKKIKKIIDDVADFSLEVKLAPDDIERMKLSLVRFMRPFIAGVLFIVTAFFVQRSGIEYSGHISIVLYLIGVLRIIFTL